MHRHFRFILPFLILSWPAWSEEAPSPPPSDANSPGQQPPGGSGTEPKKQDAVPELPPVKVIEAQPAAKPKAHRPRRSAVSSTAGAASASTGGAAQASASVLAEEAAQTAAQSLFESAKSLNAARENILPNIGVNSFDLDRQNIQALPLGDDAPIDKVLLQAPGVSQDSAASGSLHIRNEHANLQYRLNGIMLPDGNSGFGQVLETSLIGNMAVVTGALPAQYGLRTAGLVDIQTRMGSPEPSGEISIYGGSNSTIGTNLQYGGVSGNTQYFFTGRWLQNDLGIENPDPSSHAIHDQTDQEKFFSYVSTVLPNNARWTMITGASVGSYQIPNNPGQPVQYYTPTLTNFDSSKLNETQFEQYYYGILAFQQSTAFTDYQISYFSRYANLRYTPDQNGDLMFNGLATDVARTSFLNGVQADAAFRVAPDHTVRAGLVVSAEQTSVSDYASVFLAGDCGPSGQACGNTPTGVAGPIQVNDQENKLGWIAGAYVQDEWRITHDFTLNTGLRFDQMWQYVDANQLSPRIAAVYTPFDGTVLHAGYARYFTPPPQAVGAPENYALFNGTVAAAEVTPETVPGLKISPVLPERSHYFDAGITQVVVPGLEAGIAAYYKIATDLLDDGQFGQAYTLTAFNYAKGENEGVELKVKYAKDGMLLYGNLAWARQVATQFASNQYLIDLPTYLYAQDHYIYTDHAQTLTGSAGISYPIWDNTKASATMIAGSGLRAGDFNTDHVPGYVQVNLGLSHEFSLPDWKPFTLRFDVVNVADKVYELRDGSGIGVFAPQYGPRRAFLVSYSQKF